MTTEPLAQEETSSAVPEAAPSFEDELPLPDVGENPLLELDVSDDEPPPAPTVETALAKRQAIEHGDTGVSLSAEEYRLLREADRADENRRRDLARNEDARRQQVEQLRSTFTNIRSELVDEVMKQSDWLSRFGGVDDEVTKTNVSSRVEAIVGKMEQNVRGAILEPELEGLRAQILKAQNNDPEVARTVGGMRELPQLAGYVWQMGYAAGQGAGTPDGMELVKKADADRWRRADELAGRAASGESVPPTRGRQTNSRLPTMAQWMGYTFDQRQAALAKDPDFDRKIMEAGR